MIPQIFHQVWLGPPMPEEFQKYRQTWVDLHPGWEHRLWTERNMEPLRYQRFYDEAQHPAYKAEIVRVEMVRKYGGIWIDSDFECFKPIDELLVGLDAFTVPQYDSGATEFACGIYGAVPDHPWIREVEDSIPQVWKPDRMSVGPWHWTPIIRRHLEVARLPKEMFYPYSSRELHRKGEQFDGAYAAHHWAGTWVDHHNETLKRERRSK